MPKKLLPTVVSFEWDNAWFLFDSMSKTKGPDGENYITVQGHRGIWKKKEYVVSNIPEILIQHSEERNFKGEITRLLIKIHAAAYPAVNGVADPLAKLTDQNKRLSFEIDNVRMKMLQANQKNRTVGNEALQERSQLKQADFQGELRQKFAVQWAGAFEALKRGSGGGN